jgi:hypothetical protein
MGDRSVTGFAGDSQSPVIYLYSHWGASSQIADLQEAIRAAHPRWDDADYATRIAISHLIGADWNGETGYGLSVGTHASPDLPYTLNVVWSKRTVEVRSDSGAREVIGSLSFEHFLALTSEVIETALASV